MTLEADVVPGVAQSWDVLDGGRTYVFHLRDDVRWSDGVPVTAGDFEFAWKRVLNPATGSPLAGLLYDIEGARAFHQEEASDPDTVAIQARDDVTLVVGLESPIAYFLQLTAHSVALPVPRHVVQEIGAAWAEPETLVSNGPFQLRSWGKGQPLVLVRNSDYHGPSSGNVHQVELFGRATMNDREIVSLYEAGGLDHLVIGVLSDSEFLRAYERNVTDFVLPMMAAVTYYRFDVTQSPFNDIRVRRAFALATDVAALWSSTIVPPAKGGVVPCGVPAHQPGIGLPYDPERARQLLVEAGYPGGQGFPEIVCRLRLLPQLAESYRRLQQLQWVEGLGIKMKWATPSVPEMDAAQLEVPPHIFVDGWLVDYPDPDNVLRLGIAWHPTGWSNEAYALLVEEARHTLDQGKRMEMYKQADRILIEEAVVVPTEYGSYPCLVKPWVTRFPIAPLFGPTYWKDVIIEPH
jgi:ABC-type oligopeptide transport system substrate-binding subunit